MFIDFSEITGNLTALIARHLSVVEPQMGEVRILNHTLKTHLIRDIKDRFRRASGEKHSITDIWTDICHPLF